MARQWFVPGFGYVDEDGEKDYFIPGFGMINEDQAAAAPGPGPGPGPAPTPGVAGVAMKSSLGISIAI